MLKEKEKIREKDNIDILFEYFCAGIVASICIGIIYAIYKFYIFFMVVVIVFSAVFLLGFILVKLIKFINFKVSLMILTALILISCGARKTQKSETKIVAETENIKIELKKDSISTTENETKNEKISVFETQNTNETSLVFTPIDSTKSIEITDNKGNVTKIKNAKVEKRNTKLDISKSTTQIIDNEKIKNTIEKEFSEKKDLSNATITSETENKKTEREGFDWFWFGFWVIIIIILMLSGYLYYLDGKNIR